MTASTAPPGRGRRLTQDRNGDRGSDGQPGLFREQDVEPAAPGERVAAP